MPGPLGYVLVYAIESGDGIVLIDAGWEGPDGLGPLEGALRTLGAGITDVRAVIFTHSHLDHYSVGAPVRRESGAWLALHEIEAAGLAAAAQTEPDPPALDAWFAALGLDADERPDAVETALLVDRAAPRFAPDRTLAAGSTIGVDGCTLQVLHTPGHSPGHVCFVAADRGVVFTGDHVLSLTTPNVSIFPRSPGSPLDDYLSSLAKTRSLSGLLALPGHERRIGVAERSEALLLHHDMQLSHAEQLAAAGYETVREIAERMPWQTPWAALGLIDRHMALGETYAHLVVLERRGVLEQHGAPDVVRWRLAEPGRA
jgi:glyoxylase-like metal-dependent hydrolase (beta-lactamase superfamily II)